MRIEIHVKSVEEIETARAEAEATMIEGDDLVIVVAQPVPPKPAERQSAKPAS